MAISDSEREYYLSVIQNPDARWSNADLRRAFFLAALDGAIGGGGEAGPAGPPGTDGAPGAAGADGEDGLDAFNYGVAPRIYWIGSSWTATRAASIPVGYTGLVEYWALDTGSTAPSDAVNGDLYFKAVVS